MSEIPPPPAYPPPGQQPSAPSGPPPGGPLPGGPPPSGPPPSGPPPSGPPSALPGGFLVSSGPTPPRPSRGPVVALALVAVALVGCLAVGVPMVLGDDAPPAALDAVRTYDDLPMDHAEGDIDYPQSPPVGGRHDAKWLDCGVYDEPVREENAVHDLEHGTVWISYRPDLDDEGVETLAEALPQNGIMAPYPGLEAPVVVTVWGRQLELDGADDPRLELFIHQYGGGETAPEPFASCAGGLSDPTGGERNATAV